MIQDIASGAQRFLSGQCASPHRCSCRTANASPLAAPRTAPVMGSRTARLRCAISTARSTSCWSIASNARSQCLTQRRWQRALRRPARATIAGLMRRNCCPRTTTEQLTAPAPGDGHDAYPRVSPDGKDPGLLPRHAIARTTVDAAARAQETGPGKPQCQAAASVAAGRPLWRGLAASRRRTRRSGGLAGLSCAERCLARPMAARRLLGARGARFPDAHSNGSLVFEDQPPTADLWLSSVDNQHG